MIFNDFLTRDFTSMEIIFFISMSLAVFVVRYLLFSGALFALTCFLPDKFKIQKKLTFNKAQIKREIYYSLTTAPIYLMVFFGILLMAKYDINWLYIDIAEYGLWWFYLQMPLAILLWDLYFYWMHRSVHNKKLYKYFHKTHHVSTNPSPFNAITFNVGEAMLEYFYFVFIAIILPMNIWALLIVSSFGFLWSAYIHLGYEPFPRLVATGNVVNSACHHNLHHKSFNYNFGLYTVIWDKLFNTYHPESDKILANVNNEI